MNIDIAIFGKVSNNGKWHILKNWGSTVSICNKTDVNFDFSNLHRIREAKQVNSICKECLKKIGVE